MVTKPIARRLAAIACLLCYLHPGAAVVAEEPVLVFPTLTTLPWYEREHSKARIHFEPASNTISIPGEDGRHVQAVSAEVETLIFEAELLRAMGTYPQHEFVATPVGYLEKYPNDDFVNDAGGGVSPTVSGKWAYVMAGPGRDHIWETFTLAKGGRYHVWVRYQDVFTRSERFKVTIRQNDKEAGTHIFGEQDTSAERLAAAVTWSHFAVDLVAGQARLDLAKVPDDPGIDNQVAGPRYVDQIMLTNDLSYIPVGPEQLSWAGVQERLGKLGVVDEEFVVWSRSAWAGVSNKSWPASKAELDPELELRACIGEREQMLYLITNTSAETIQLSLAAQLQSAADDSTPIDGVTRLSLLSFIKSKRFGWVPDVLIPCAKLGRVTIAPYHTAGVWIELDTQGLASGAYRGALRIDGSRQRSVPFQLTVLPVTLPAELDIFTLVWHAEGNWIAADPAKIEFLYEHGINAATCSGPEQGTAEAWGARPMKLLLTGTPLEAMSDLGFRPYEWAYYLTDEPGDSNWPTRAELAKKIEAEHPQARIAANPTWNKHASIETFQGLEPYVDLWLPYATHLRYPDALKLMRDSGAQIGFYKCDGFLTKNPAMCFNYFRKFTWVAFRYGIDGCGFWSLSQVRGHPWYDFDRPGFDGSGTDPLVVYPDKTGYYATRNIEGFREGTEDYKYLMLLRDRVPPERLQGVARRMLASTTVAEVAAVREELLDMLARGAD